MARPQKNNADYFSHDNSMRNDRKILALRNKFGLKGYAIWNMLLEVLTEADNFEIKLDNVEIGLLAGEFNTDCSNLEQLIAEMVKLRLLKQKDNLYWSDKLKQRLSPVIEKRQKAREQSKQQARKKDGTFGNSTRNDRNTVKKVVSATETPISATETPKSTVQPVVSVAETPQSKVNKSKVNKKKDNINILRAKPVDEINQVLNIFYENINQGINYTNKSNRNSAKWLIDKYGLDETLKIAKLACSVQGQKYMPIITTPTQLKDKMAQLRIQLQNNNQLETKAIRI